MKSQVDLEYPDDGTWRQCDTVRKVLKEVICDKKFHCGTTIRHPVWAGSSPALDKDKAE